MYLTKEELANEIRRVVVNTRYPVYNVNTGTVPSSITTYLEYVVALRSRHRVLEKNKNIKKYEIILVGAGVSNAYLSYLLKQKYPKLKILVIEKTNRVGGRTLSMESDGDLATDDYVKDELGAMRLFKVDEMKPLIDLIEKLGLTLQPVGLDESQNFFYYQDKKYLKSEFKLPNGDSVSKFQKDTLNNFRADYEERNQKTFTTEDAYDDEFLRNHSLSQYYKKYNHATTDEILQIINAYSGYDFYPNDVQACVSIANFLDSTDQYYVKEGIDQIAKRLFEKANVEFMLNTEVRKITKEHDYKIVNTVDANGNVKKFKSKFISLSGSTSQVQSIISNEIISENRINMCKYSKGIPLFKAFLQFSEENKWWGENTNFKEGKTTTDLDIRQLHYYDYEDILIYNSSIYATKLNNLFRTNLKTATNKVLSDIRKIHGDNIPDPESKFTLYKYWPEGSHKWKIGADILEFEKEILNGIKDNSNIFIVGDAFSRYQGWIIGAFGTANKVFDLLNENCCLKCY